MLYGEAQIKVLGHMDIHYVAQFSLALTIKLQFTTQNEKSIGLYVRAPTNYVNASFTTRCGAMGLMKTTYVLTNDDVNVPFSIGVTTTSYSTMTGPIMLKEITRSTLESTVGWVYLVDGIEITTILVIQRNNKIYTKISTHRIFICVGYLREPEHLQ